MQIKCEHMWPTPADMALLKGKPRSEWIRPEPMSVQQIDFYLGRVPEWYIEQKFLKKPGIHSQKVSEFKYFQSFPF